MNRKDHLGRRNFYRIKATYLVNYRPIGYEDAQVHYSYALTKDISAGGLLVMSETNFPKGTQMEMIISLPMYPNKRIVAIGDVTSDFPEDVRKPLYPTRIRFVEFDETAFKKLKEFIENEMNKEKGGLTLKQKMDRRKE